MKIYVRTAIFLLITFISLNVYAKDKDKLLIGKWKGIDNHSHFGELIFEKSQYAFFKIEDSFTEGKTLFLGVYLQSVNMK